MEITPIAWSGAGLVARRGAAVVRQAPGVVDLVAIMGRRRTLARLGHALQVIQEGLPDDDPERLKAEAEAAAKAANAGKGKRRPPMTGDRG